MIVNDHQGSLGTTPRELPLRAGKGETSIMTNASSLWQPRSEETPIGELLSREQVRDLSRGIDAIRIAPPDTGRSSRTAPGEGVGRRSGTARSGRW